MPIRVTLRTKKEFSPFRVLLKKLIELADGDSLVLCSGYIQEVDLQENPRSYNISGDDLFASIKNGCSHGKVTTVAGKLKQYNNQPSEWEKRYALFIKHLRAEGLAVDAWVAPEKNWHAKIAIRLKNEVPIAALIGSSNLTRPAYGVDKVIPRVRLFKDWNFEGDVLLWSDSQYNDYFKEDIEPQRGIGDMILVLDPEVQQPDEHHQLWNIYKYVMNETEKFESSKE